MEAEADAIKAILCNGLIKLEDYPNYPKGPCVLVLQKNRKGKPIHIVWGIPKNANMPAVVVTAYRPNSDK